MIKRLLKKDCEQIVKACEYYRVAIQQEQEDRAKERRQYEYVQMQQQQQQQLHQQAPVGTGGGDEHRQYLQHPHHHVSSPYYQQQQQQQHSSPSPSSFTSHNQSPHPSLHSDLQMPSSSSMPHLRPGHTIHHPHPLPSSTSAVVLPISPQQKAAPHLYHHPHPPPSPHYTQLPILHPTTSSISTSTVTPSTSASSLQKHHPPSPHYTHLHHPPPLPTDHMHTQQKLFNLHHDRNPSDGRISPAGKFDTMIKKLNTLDDDNSGAMPWKNLSTHSYRHAASPGNNGLRRVDSEGSPFSTAAAKSHSKGFPPRAVSIDHVPISRKGGGGGFTDLFESTNVQETFV